MYGLPEQYRDQIASARLVANPGCYPTSIILGLAPLLSRGLVSPEGLILDSKSGATGAGRAPHTATLFWRGGGRIPGLQGRWSAPPHS